MNKYILILGDILAILLTTLIGFITHNEMDMSYMGRMSAVFFPLVAAWFLLAPWFGLFQQEVTSSLSQLWRPVLAMIFSAPLAAVLRALMLGTPIIPIFAVVLGATSAFGMLIWRAIYYFISHKYR